jgi:sugar/nucleoside kinase (ribokinase family)
MTSAQYGLLAIGNALADVLLQVSEEFLAEQMKIHGMARNSMNLIDAEKAIKIYDAMKGATVESGGSAGNTIAGFASFGGKGAYFGKIGKDPLGGMFRNAMQAMGVNHSTTPVESGTQTGRCMIMITPDGDRTMNTFLGAGVELSPGDIDDDIVANSAVTYLEGYLFDPPLAMEAFYKAARIAHDAGRKVSLSLSDPFCVGRHREAFLNLVEGHVDILFANEEELKSLYQTQTFEEAAARIAGKCDIAAITRSEKGSVILQNDSIIEIEALQTEVVDTTGAGDQYAAGFLYGYTEGMSMADCGRIASAAAAEVISHVGPRPLIDLKQLLAA